MITIEHTDTFGGDANYCWVKRWHSFSNLTDLQSVRLAKRLCSLTGHPCRVENWSDCVAIYPRGICQVIFIGWQEDDAPLFGQPATEEDERTDSCEVGPFAVATI